MTENTKRKITVMKGIGRNGDMNANESKVKYRNDTRTGMRMRE